MRDQIIGPMPDGLNDADRAILDLLQEGRGEDEPWGKDLPNNIADELGYSRQYVQNRLQLLEAYGYVENAGGGLYVFREDPRDDES